MSARWVDAWWKAGADGLEYRKARHIAYRLYLSGFLGESGLIDARCPEVITWLLGTRPEFMAQLLEQVKNDGN